MSSICFKERVLPASSRGWRAALVAVFAAGICGGYIFWRGETLPGRAHELLAESSRLSAWLIKNCPSPEKEPALAQLERLNAGAEVLCCSGDYAGALTAAGRAFCLGLTVKKTLCRIESPVCKPLTVSEERFLSSGMCKSALRSYGVSYGGDSNAANAPEKAGCFDPLPGRVELLKGMALVPAGDFQMGSREGEGASEEHPRHGVYLNAYYIDRHEVTAGQYKKFTGSTGRKMRKQELWSTAAHPVVNVNWYDAWAYCKWAGGRLPSEAEWEKAALGGGGEDYDMENYARRDKDSWNGGNSVNLPRPVGLKEPNRFGLYDMRGNVWEWTADWLDYQYYSKSPAQNPPGPDSGAYRVLRGGSVCYSPFYLRLTYRNSNFPGFRSGDIGFRCAASAVISKP